MLTRDLENYRQFTRASDLEKIFEFMPPKLFEVAPRDSLLTMMRSAMDNEYMSIEMMDMKYKQKGKPKIQKAGPYYWALVAYEGSMRIVFKGEQGDNALIMTIMKSQFGKENVKEAGDSALDIILRDQAIIAFKDPSAATWWMIADKRKEIGEGSELQAMIYETAVPEVVRKALENKK